MAHVVQTTGEVRAVGGESARAPAALTERQTAVALAALLGGALALRPQLIAIGPLTLRIQEDLGLSHGVAGLMSTIPLLCMGLFAPAAPVVVRRIGTSRAVTAALAGIAVLGCARAFVPSAAGVLALTLPLGIAIALGNALMPIAVARSKTSRPMLATGAYTTGMTCGSIAAALIAVPLADAFGGWRAALAAFAIAAFVSLAIWAGYAARSTAPAPVRAVKLAPLPWRSALAWRLVLAFSAITIFFYGAGAWLPASYVEHGWTQASAAVLMVVWNIGALAGGVGISLIGDHVGSRRGALLVSTALMMIAMVLLILAPGPALAWAAIAGLGNGAVFTVLMTLPLDLGRGAAQAAAVSGMMLGVGYSTGALGPFAMGVLRDATGSFTSSLWILVAVAGVIGLAALRLGPEDLRRGLRADPRRRPPLR